MKIVFMGTPDFAVPILDKLVKEHVILAVYTRAPKVSGRGNRINKTPVHLWAEAHQIPVHTPKSLKSEEEQAIMRSYQADLGIVAAYGLLLPQAVLDMYPKGCINVHASLLPRWRGAAPIQRAIEAGDKQSGISIMQMALELDAGDVLAQEATPINKNTTGGDLHDTLADIGANLLCHTLANLDTITPIKQDESLVTYAEKLDKTECLIDFKMAAEKLVAKIRAFNPYPAMYFMYKGERFKVYEAEVCDMSDTPGKIIDGKKRLVITTGDNAINITKIQREGKQPMLINDLLRGFQFDNGTLI
ncbi:MAG: methionyl-tRNA formyltransferase [Alphaproteobacteria bacterium]|nr:methionyl-tRNA formyltransferase [Alphaproteobacteria bacterium]